MKSEKQKMLDAELYNPLDLVLVSDRLKSRLLIKELNDSREDEKELRLKILKELIPQ